MSPEVLVKSWFQRVVFAFLIALCTLGVIIITSLIWNEYFNEPPVEVISLDAENLGVLTPGQELTINNDITITKESAVHYLVSVMDEGANFNYPNTQDAYLNYLHPKPSRFKQVLPWTVPDLPPGKYTRVFAIRNIVGDQDTVFVKTQFSIGEPQ